jgi:4-alpha-glucanotransferase
VGAGDFGDLKMLVDVAAAAGMTVVQLLPVNDTSVHGMWWDSYPYSSVSVIALHPLYLRLQPLVAAGAALAAFEGNAGNSTLFAGLQAEVARAAATLDTKEVDYEATMRVKMSVARRCFDATRTAFLSSPALVAFLEENQEWLKPYAVFRVLADVFGTAQHWRWGTMGAGDAAAVVSRLSAPDSHLFPAVAAHYYVQFHLHHQLLAAAAHAGRRGVVLKGDLPIGVDKASVDTWTHPELFRMDTSTGAPPDGFDPNGQNWGFPTYNWDNMAKDGYAWWRGRMTHLERYFSAMRVDHVLGFFRIWELPGHTRTGRMGRFRPSLPVRRSELDARGLWFIDRLCDPHITARLLKETFQDRDGEVAGRFLDKSGSCQLPDGSSTITYCFKPDFATEEGLLESDAFKVRGGSPDWLVAETAAMRAGLLHLQHNVCLLRDPLDPDAFYPRIEMDKTHSFQELQDWARHGLSWLYDDYFHHRQDALWRENARRTLPALMTCTGQLVCGEDLGMVPPCVPPVLEELGILGLRIQRMPHAEGDGNGDRSGDGGGDGEGGGDGGGGGGGVEFGRPGGYPYQTVCSPSCHDTSTTRAWYEADAGRRARYARGVLGMTGDGRLASEFPPPMSYRAERVEEGSGSSEKRRTSAGSVGAADLMGVVGIVDCDGIVIEDTGLGGGGGGMGGGGRGAGGDGSGSQHPQHPPPDKCEPQVMRAIIRQHMASPSVLAVFPVQDLLALAGEYAQRPAEEETINDPTNPRHYWRFRMHVRLEDLLGNAAWLADIRQLVNEAGRAPVRSAGGRVSDAADT